MSKNIVFVSGHFNVLHPGHLRLLRFAQECGEKLVVGVLSDRLAGKNAHVPESLRLEGIKSNSVVDEAVLINEPVAQFIARTRPAIVVKGKEHETQFNEEQEALDAYGGKLIFCSGETIFSSVDLIRKEFFGSEETHLNMPLAFMHRHGLSSTSLRAILERFKSLKVCVIGDLIIDEYITCQPLGMSQEDPTIVVTPLDSTKFVGGAGIVAAHAAGLGAHVNFITVTGQDVSRDFARTALIDAGVNSEFIVDENRPTTLKQRFRSKGKSLLRVSYLHQGSISSELQKKFLEKLEKAMEGAQLLVFSDFNYGCLPQSLVEKAIEMARKRGMMLAADSQSSSQIGDIGRYKFMDLITPTEREARISTRNHEDGLVILAEKLRLYSGAKNILLKMGEEGLLIHADHSKNDQAEWLTDKVGALNPSPKDVAGAGDSLLIAAALTMACGGNIWEASCLGSLAAAIQVSRVGNKPLRLEELARELD